MRKAPRSQRDKWGCKNVEAACKLVKQLANLNRLMVVCTLSSWAKARRPEQCRDGSKRAAAVGPLTTSVANAGMFPPTMRLIFDRS
jgi:hypothetical protein